MKTKTQTLRVAVVDDSSIARAMLRETLEEDGDIQVVGEAADGEGALRMLAERKPDLATVDILMPGMNGLELIEQIMARCPVPILVVTGQPVGPAGAVVFEAVRRGALDVASKPAEGAPASAALRVLVRRLASVPVVPHLAGLRRDATGRHATAPLRTEQPPDRLAGPAPGGACTIVGIGASAGGPGAIAAVLAALPRDFGACVAVVQHLPPGFTESFVEFLRTKTTLAVGIVDRRMSIASGTVLVAPDDRHLVAMPGNILSPFDAPPLEGHRPSVTVLLRSLGEVFGAAAAGVVLSGIGHDGAEGLATIHAKGGVTFAQDQATSVVWGMPRAAAEAGAVTRVLPLPAIGPALIEHVGTGRPRRRA